MNETNSIITLVGAVLGILGLVALAIAIFRASITKQTLELLRNDRNDANARADGIRDDFEIFKAKTLVEQKHHAEQLVAYEIKDSEKSQEIMILRNIVTGKDQLDRIEKILTTLAESKITQ